MNGFEQRVRHTAIAQAEAQLAHLTGALEALATIVQAIDERQVALAQGIADAFDANAARVDALGGTVGQLQTDLAFERRKRQQEIDACETALANEQRIRADYRASLWQRLRWIAVGR